MLSVKFREELINKGIDTKVIDGMYSGAYACKTYNEKITEYKGSFIISYIYKQLNERKKSIGCYVVTGSHVIEFVLGGFFDRLFLNHKSIYNRAYQRLSSNNLWASVTLIEKEFNDYVGGAYKPTLNYKRESSHQFILSPEGKSIKEILENARRDVLFQSDKRYFKDIKATSGFIKVEPDYMQDISNDIAIKLTNQGIYPLGLFSYKTFI